MDRKYQIFISSTFADLKEERRIVMETILKFGHIPVGMEMFKAGNESQWKIIEERIRDCDYYLVIVGDRYGTTDEQGKSYTEREYDFAVENGIPVAAFLTDKGVRAAPGRQLDDLEDALKLERFRRKCSAGKVVAVWGTPDRLALECMASLHELTTKYPRPGWISGRNAAGPEVLTQFAKMAAENEQLRTQLDEANRKLAKQLDDREVEEIIKKLEGYQLKIEGISGVHLFVNAVELSEAGTRQVAAAVTITAAELIGRLTRPLLYGIRIQSIHDTLSSIFRSKLIARIHSIQENLQLVEHERISLECPNLDTLLDFLCLSDILEREGHPSDYSSICRFTKKGRRLGRRLFVLES